MTNINKTVVIVGTAILLGVGAYIYFKPKATDENTDGNSGTDATGGANSGSTGSTANSGDNIVVQTRDNVTNEPLRNPIVKTLTNADILAIQKLRDDILANMTRKGSYKKQGSRNAVQADIDIQFERLKEYGYSLDLNNNLIKIV